MCSRQQSAREQQGFGSANVGEDDKTGAIDDDLAEMREEARRCQAQAQTQAQSASQHAHMESYNKSTNACHQFAQACAHCEFTYNLA